MRASLANFENIRFPDSAPALSILIAIGPAHLLTSIDALVAAAHRGNAANQEKKRQILIAEHLTPDQHGSQRVLVAPPNTAAYPSAAASGTGTPSIGAAAAPSVAPMENSGVTSPPWNPTARVTTVKSSLARKSQPYTVPSEKARPIKFVPSPE